jgi:hypothetical protein
LVALGFAQRHSIEAHEVPKVTCADEVPKDFTCAVLLRIDPVVFDGPDIASVIGGKDVYVRPDPVIRQVVLVLGDTAYTAVYDPALKRTDKFSGLTPGRGIPARVDGDDLFVR